MLPTYGFQRERYWIPHARPDLSRTPAEPDSLLGRAVSSPALDATVFESIISATSPDFLNDHRVYGTAIMPAAGYVTQALLAATEILGVAHSTIDAFTIHEALVLPEVGSRALQMVVKPLDSGARRSRYAAYLTWALPDAARQRHTPIGDAECLRIIHRSPNLAIVVRERLRKTYSRARGRHIDFGPEFQWISRTGAARAALGQIGHVRVSAPAHGAR